jgi:hypothetical protein
VTPKGDGVVVVAADEKKVGKVDGCVAAAKGDGLVGVAVLKREVVGGAGVVVNVDVVAPKGEGFVVGAPKGEEVALAKGDAKGEGLEVVVLNAFVVVG